MDFNKTTKIIVYIADLFLIALFLANFTWSLVNKYLSFPFERSQYDESVDVYFP